MINFKDRAIGLSLFRILISFLLIRNLFIFMNYKTLLFTNEGIVFNEYYHKVFSRYGLDYFYYLIDYIGVPSYLYLMALVVFLFALGIGRWVTGIILFFLVLSLHFLNTKILDGSDNVILVTLPLLALADSYKYFTIKFKTKRISRTTLLNKLSVTMFLYQVCIIYLITGLAKLKSDVWLNGTALSYILQLNEFKATSYNSFIANNVFISGFLTYSTLVFELLFPLILFVKRLKIPWLIMGVLFHIGIYVFMKIDVFPWIMIATYFVFISDIEYLAFANKINENENIGKYISRFSAFFSKLSSRRSLK